MATLEEVQAWWQQNQGQVQSQLQGWLQQQPWYQHFNQGGGSGGSGGGGGSGSGGGGGGTGGGSSPPPVTTPDPVTDTTDMGSGNDYGPEFDNAWEMLSFYLEDWGLEALSPHVKDMLIEGSSPEVITLRLRETPEYKQRFKANDLRRQAGLPVLSPADYVATERQYRNELRRWGMPETFYDQQEDFVAFLERDVSPQELSDRVQNASERYINASAEMKEQLERVMGTVNPSLIIAGLLDPDRALPLIEREISMAAIASEAQRAFSDRNRLTLDRAEELARAGVSDEDARRGFGELAGRQERDTFLSSLSGRDLTENEQENELFFNDQAAGAKRRKAMEEERGRFGQNFLAQQSGLNRESAGQY